MLGDVDNTAKADGYSLVWDATAGKHVYKLAGSQPQAGTNINIDNTNPAKPIISSTLGAVALKGRVATYANLPSSGNTAGDAYVNDADGLIYVWDGTAWPANGAGLSFGTSSAPVDDPYYSQVVSLCHFQGAPLSTPVDEVAGVVWSTAGATMITPALPKWGKTSLYGNGNYAKCTLASGVAIGTQDFTIDFWFRPYSLTSSSYGRIFQIGPDTQNGAVAGGLYFYNTGTQQPGHVGLQGCAGGAYISFIASANMPNIYELVPHNWYHIAIQRSGLVWSVFIDGYLYAQGSYGSSAYNIAYNYYTLAANPNSGEALYGHYADVRFTLGLARYTGNFKRPTGPYKPFPYSWNY
jgi:hypothetical protein